jgi:outer membrane lipoprotein-sorting protein
MECENCKLEMVNLFDSNVNPANYATIMLHIQQCPSCQSDFEKAKAVATMLKPQNQPSAPILLKQNIMNQLKMEEEKMKTQEVKKVNLNSRFAKIIGVAAAVVLIMVAIPIVDNTTNVFNHSARAANSFIEGSIRATQYIKSMVINLKVRTDAYDNFSLVGTKYELVNHKIFKTFASPAKWRVEKPGRTVVFDGTNQLIHIAKVNSYLKAPAGYNVTEYFQILLEPEKVLAKEQNIIKSDGSKFIMDEKNGQVYLTITSNAKGNFINDYTKNSSIDESDNRREYIFDKETKLLKGLRIFILEGKKETLIVEIESIDYNVDISENLFSLNLPNGAAWQELNQVATSEIFRNISSKRAAELFFEGLSKSNWQLASQTFQLLNSNTDGAKRIKENYGGLTLVRLGEPFKSGQYPGEYIPYEVKLKSGKTIKHNLAMRNDNPNKVWVVDGGF